MRRLTAAVLMFFLLAIPLGALASQTLEEEYFTVYDEGGTMLFRTAGDVSAGDEYISGTNALYQIQSVDEGRKRAFAQWIGEEPPTAWPAYSSLNETLQTAAAPGKKRLICLYCTHSDESYIPTDGHSSSDHRGGIYDVAEAFASALNARGIETILDETLHHPHDAGAYRRSRSTAAILAKKTPAALIDIHRDGVPADEYKGEVMGEPTSMVRLLVGRANPNSAANREFAKQLKATADAMYPGLIKDIFIGKGNYNQELMPHSILLEFGTYKLEKEMAEKATDYMADVMLAAVFGDAAYAPEENAARTRPTTTPRGAIPPPAASPPATQPAPAAQQAAERPLAESNRGSASGILWILGLFAAGLVVVGLIIGGVAGLSGRLGRTASEMSGGLFGKKPKDGDRLS